jgi:hypothetical protein
MSTLPNPDDGAGERIVADALHTLSSTAWIVVAFDAEGRIIAANSYTNPARVIEAVDTCTAPDIGEYARVLPAEPLAEKDFAEPVYTTPRFGGDGRVHILEDVAGDGLGKTWCTLIRNPRQLWVPVADPAFGQICPLCLTAFRTPEEREPMPLTPGELYDALGGELDRASRWDSWRPWKPVVWLTRPTVHVRDRTWDAVAVHNGHHGYSARQARAIRAALAEMMRDRAPELERAIAFHAQTMGFGPCDPSLHKQD